MKYIVRKADIDAMEGQSKTHFLNENAVRLNKSLGDIVGLENLGFHLIDVEPGHESTEYHVHYYEDECVYILEGDATVTIDEIDYEVGAGDFVGYPAAGLAHTMKNTGSITLKCIVVGQRLDGDIGDYPRLKKRIYRNKLGTDVVDINSIQHPEVGVKK